MYPCFLCYFPFDQEDSLTLITLPDSAGFLFLISIIIKIPLQGDYRPVTIKYQRETFSSYPFCTSRFTQKASFPLVGIAGFLYRFQNRKRSNRTGGWCAANPCLGALRGRDYSS